MVTHKWFAYVDSIWFFGNGYLWLSEHIVYMNSIKVQLMTFISQQNILRFRKSCGFSLRDINP